MGNEGAVGKLLHLESGTVRLLQYNDVVSLEHEKECVRLAFPDLWSVVEERLEVERGL